MAMTNGSASGWSDGKRYLWLLGALTITLPILGSQLDAAGIAAHPPFASALADALHALRAAIHEAEPGR